MKNYSNDLADIILDKFSVHQMKRNIYFDKIPRLIFHLNKDEKEQENYTRLDEILRCFNGKLEWGIFRCPRSKVNYMVSPSKWVKIEQDINFKGEQYLFNNPEYIELLELATADYFSLVEYLKSNL